MIWDRGANESVEAVEDRVSGSVLSCDLKGNERKETFCVVFEYEKGWHKNGGPKMILKPKLRSFIRLRRKSQTLPVDEFTAAWVKPCP